MMTIITTDEQTFEFTVKNGNLRVNLNGKEVIVQSIKHMAVEEHLFFEYFEVDEKTGKKIPPKGHVPYYHSSYPIYVIY